MHQVKASNPFYAALLVVGVVFAITACAYCVMMVRGLEPRPDETGLMGLMSQHGLAIMVVELVLLGLLTVAAIGTDGYWEPGDGTRESGIGRAEVGGQRSEVGDQKGEREGGAPTA